VRTRALLLALLGAACKSTAPYAVPAAAINTGVAAGFAAAQRSRGGCYATCTNGTTCNPRTGLCDRVVPGCACPQGKVCVEGTGGLAQCVSPAPTMLSEQQREVGSPVSIGPAPGSVPSLPVRP